MSDTTFHDTLPCVSQSYDKLVQGWVRANFSGVKYAAKKLATLVNVSTRTSENWIQGRTTPRGDDLINLCVECDDLVQLLISEVNRRKAAKKST